MANTLGTQAGRLLVNEVAPRAHNSGHHTIEQCATSQFGQLLRATLDLPLGDVAPVRAAAGGRVRFRSPDARRAGAIRRPW